MSQKGNMDFSPGAWLGDAGLQLCSLQAKGLWMEMLCRMWQGEKRGHLSLGGKPLTLGQLSQLVGYQDDEVQACLIELEANHVFSRTDDGVIYSRRMARETAAATAAAPAQEREQTVNGKPIPPCPVDAIVDLYHEHLPKLPKVQRVVSKRRDMLRARWRESWEDAFAKGKDWKTVDDGLKYFGKFFAFIASSCPFLLGENQDNDERKFQADFEWIVTPSNWVKIMEGKYSGDRRG